MIKHTSNSPAQVTRAPQTRQSRLARLALALMLLFLILIPGASAGAQTAPTADLSTPDITGFPQVTARLRVFDSQGAFVRGLLPADITLLEAKRSLPAELVREVQTGVRFLVAVNAAPSLGVRNAQGAARYDPIYNYLQLWASQQDTGKGGQYSLVTNDGGATALLDDPNALVEAVAAYQPNFKKSTPSFDSLSQALQLAGDPGAAADVQRAVLYIGPLPAEEDEQALADISSQAKAGGTAVFVWMIASQEDFDNPRAAWLQQLASSTGGRYYPFSGEEPVQDINLYLEPLRFIYQVSYTTAVVGEGPHSLSAHIQKDDLDVTSGIVSLDLTVAPPNPMFVDPPEEIVRTAAVSSAAGASGSADGAQAQASELQPMQQALQFLVEFPDGHPRELTLARLYVDGAVAAEQTQPPFQELVWDLSTYTSSGEHQLKLEVQDSLGLKQTTIEIPVNISVPSEAAAASHAAVESRSTILIASSAAVAAGAALALVLILGRQRRTAGAGRSASAGRNASAKDPVTQPVPVPGEKRHAAPWLAWPRQSAAHTLAAQLVRLDENLQPLPSTPIPILSREVTFGRDPNLASCVLEAPSIEALHARLRQVEDGSAYILSDQSAIAGTWVNFAPVSGEGARLEHGDIIHIGRVAFRYQESSPAHPRKPQVRPYKETA